MPESRLTLFYGDRELIPVRAIPFVTGWDISPDGVAKDLARRGLPVFSRLKSIHAYHLVDGKPVPILPKEWDAAVCGMEALEAELRFQFKDNRRGYQAWRQRSPSVLPAGVFVWQDEFESGYFDELRREWERLGGNRPGDDQINYMPMLSSELRDAVFEGFNLPGRELAELYKEQDARWRAAGRCTLEEVSLELAQQTGWEKSRWLQVIIDAVRKGALKLSNPKDPGDRLPYPAPTILRDFYDQVTGEDVNTWLDANPAWKVTYRIPSPAQGSAVEKSVTTEAADDPPWVTESRRLADEIGQKKWLNGIQEITGRSISAPVANELSKNREYWGLRGPRTPGTIRKALTGWKFQPGGGASGASGAKGSPKAIAPRTGRQKPTKIVT